MARYTSSAYSGGEGDEKWTFIGNACHEHLKKRKEGFCSEMTKRKLAFQPILRNEDGEETEMYLQCWLQAI